MPHDERSRLRTNEMVVENSPSDPRHDHRRAEPQHREVETPDRAQDRKRDRLRTLACLASAASDKNRGLDHGCGRWERLRKPSIRRAADASSALATTTSSPFADARWTRGLKRQACHPARMLLYCDLARTGRKHF
jgi:hypothetical protein